MAASISSKGSENCLLGVETDCLTLTRMVRHDHHASSLPNPSGDLPQLLSSLLTAIKAISAAVRKAGFAQLYGVSGTKNIHGDVVQRLDLLANELLINLLRSSFQACALISEESDTPIKLNSHDGRFVVAFDPLDGSCNIDVHVTIGTIFSIWQRESPCDGDVQDSDLLQSGRKLVAAGYAVYGTATIVVLSTGKGVNGFTLDPLIGAFILSHPNIRIPTRGDIYSTNEGYKHHYSDGLKAYMQHINTPKPTEPAMTQRYVGSFIADLHRTLIKGGIFFYPYMVRSGRVDRSGKLRLMYECAPLAYIVEQAGGLASTGLCPILDVQPTSVHQRSPIFIGSHDNVTECLQFLHKFDQSDHHDEQKS